MSYAPATKPSDHVFLDISKIKKPEALKPHWKSNWRMIVDETTKFNFGSFHETKNGMINPTCTLIKKVKNMDITTKVIRCDNAGENKSLEKVMKGKDS